MRGIGTTRYRLRDLMVLVTVACLLLAIVMPAVRAFREAAALREQNSLKRFRLALCSYHQPIHVAKNHGTADAERDITADEFNFRIGGKPCAWFDHTATVFRDRYGANLVLSGCCTEIYDSAYNDIIAAGLAQRVDGFSFDEAYHEADEEGRKQLEKRFARQ